MLMHRSPPFGGARRAELGAGWSMNNSNDSNTNNNDSSSNNNSSNNSY